MFDVSESMPFVRCRAQPARSAACGARDRFLSGCDQAPLGGQQPKSLRLCRRIVTSSQCRDRPRGAASQANATYVASRCDHSARVVQNVIAGRKVSGIGFSGCRVPTRRDACSSLSTLARDRTRARHPGHLSGGLAWPRGGRPIGQINQLFERSGHRPRALPDAVIEQTRGLPGAALGGALQVQQEVPRRMARLQRLDGAADAGKNHGQLVVEVMGNRGGGGAQAIGFREAFHITG